MIQDLRCAYQQDVKLFILHSIEMIPFTVGSEILSVSLSESKMMTRVPAACLHPFSIVHCLVNPQTIPFDFFFF
jgi:hypothetical protein